MAKIDNLGLEKLQHIHNAINAIFDKLDADGSFDKVQSEFEFITEILEDAKNNWEKV